MSIRDLTKEQLVEESLIDLTFAILEERKTPIAFLDLVAEIQKLQDLSDAEMKDRLVQFYTDLNIDGRFLINHDNTWGLREWYKIETVEEETAPTIKKRKRRGKLPLLDDDEEEIIVDEEDLVFEEDLEEFVDDETSDDDEDVDDDNLDFDEEDIDEDDIDDLDDDLIDKEKEKLMIDDEENKED